MNDNGSGIEKTIREKIIAAGAGYPQPKVTISDLPKVPKAKPFVDDLDIPKSYNHTYIVLMTRDPNCVFAYWEMEPSKIEYAKKILGNDFYGSKYVIRVYDVTLINFNGSNANSSFDVEINGVADNWYINSVKDNANYCAKLGLRKPNGDFFPIAMSNFSDTPRRSPSNNHNEIWKNSE